MFFTVSYSFHTYVSTVLHVQPAHCNRHHYSTITTSDSFRHDAARQSLTTAYHFPIPNHTTTGHGHQDARAATGTVTFYNGLFTQQFVASGTVYTGQDGVAIVTTQDATIPPGSPGTGYGTVTIAAQAVTAGTSGNIQAGDIKHHDQ